MESFSGLAEVEAVGDEEEEQGGVRPAAAAGVGDGGGKAPALFGEAELVSALVGSSATVCVYSHDMWPSIISCVSVCLSVPDAYPRTLALWLRLARWRRRGSLGCRPPVPVHQPATRGHAPR
jgi:hypothetical protein